MLYAGLDLSRKRLDVRLLAESGETVLETAVFPDREGLGLLSGQVAVAGGGELVYAAIESMTGARFVHDELETLGWDVEVADVVKVKGLAPLACKTDRIDAWVLAELCRLQLVPAIWLPDPTVRVERERARFRLHLVHHRVQLKNRIHATLVTFGKPCPVSDLFGRAGRELLGRLEIPEPWATTLAASLALIDTLNVDIARVNTSCATRELTTPTCHCSKLRRVSAGSSATPSRQRSATSADSRAPRNSPATAASVHASTSPAPPTGAANSPRTDRVTCAGHSSKPPPTPAATRRTETTTNTPKHAWAANGRQSRPRRGREQTRHRDLAHAHQRRTVRSGRSPARSGRLTTLQEMDHRRVLPPDLILR